MHLAGVLPEWIQIVSVLVLAFHMLVGNERALIDFEGPMCNVRRHEKDMFKYFAFG